MTKIKPSKAGEILAGGAAKAGWEPPFSFEERLKGFIPPKIRMRYLYNKNMRVGEPELRLIPFLTDKQRVSIDVGANKGVYSYAMLRYSQSVHAFEPNPKLFRILSRWASGKVILHPDALSNRSGTAELLIPRARKGYSNQGASLSTTKVSGDHRSISVTAVRLDDLGIQNIGFIKIDVEGFEKEVLEGAERTLRRDRPTLLVEMEEAHTGIPIDEMVSSVEGYGYECLVLAEGTLMSYSTDREKRRQNPANHRDYIFNFIFLPRG